MRTIRYYAAYAQYAANPAAAASSGAAGGTPQGSSNAGASASPAPPRYAFPDRALRTKHTHKADLRCSLCAPANYFFAAARPRLRLLLRVMRRPLRRRLRGMKAVDPVGTVPCRRRRGCRPPFFSLVARSGSGCPLRFRSRAAINRGTGRVESAFWHAVSACCINFALAVRPGREGGEKWWPDFGIVRAFSLLFSSLTLHSLKRLRTDLGTLQRTYRTS